MALLSMFWLHISRSQQQLLDTTLSSSTSKASIKEPPKAAAPIPEETTPSVPEIKEDLVTNGDAEGKICTFLPFLAIN